MEKLPAPARPLFWVGSSRKDYRDFPPAVQDSFGFELFLARLGQHPPSAKLLKGLGINSHRNFYTLRHNFETIAGESKDQVAVDSIMGHVDPSMGAAYREKISDARLRAVVDTVRAWLKQRS